MDWSSVHPTAWFELFVVVFQVVGVAALCLHRLLPGCKCGSRACTVLVLAMIGLGLSGAYCGSRDSAFSLFAGGTLTFLLIGMIAGSGHADPTATVRHRAVADPQPVG